MKAQTAALFSAANHAVLAPFLLRTAASLLAFIVFCPFQVLSAHTHPDSPYLFPFLSGTKKGEAAYREYTSSLARFNRDLKALAQATGVSSPVSSYTIRHSFASILKELDVPIEMISELLGHKSIKTTQIYLKSFSLEKMASVSRMCFESVCVCEAE